ncbi:Glycoside hydrolase superfamily [Penicillium cf. griseofulvum]|uniref:Beta-mannosidase A n=1 Tax=Penicillium cf. griseofulvum TaxID=2972120 RepID=A0A9W9J2J0_9EURO|nr:Glycoside hydrolase superfamily [Penicillium cf. griseofulvum]KAJ5435185.1 Glycoside hydrolase superfamily [Penicillium cf. griseofulvum]KAJ5453017.1 Glycoside hydrolase superfamily [Penicillium cf. griseofulvum]
MHLWNQLVLAVLPSVLPTTLGQNVLDLSGDGWTVRSNALNISVPGSVPSQVHLDLLHANVIDEPYYGLNDFNLRWIAENNWTYTSKPIDGLLSNSKSSWLVFNGLDTFTTIEFCGQFIGTTDNQFRQYTFDISDALKHCNGLPTVSLEFGSAIKFANAIADNPNSQKWPAGVQGTFEFPNRWYIRKEQSDFGWDWGPAFSPAGPWQNIYLVQSEREEDIYVINTGFDIYRKGQINHLAPDQSQPWVVNASIDYLGTLLRHPSMSIEIKDIESGKVLKSGSLDNVVVSGQTITGTTIVDANAPSLWWPAGMGKQSLYNIKVTIHSANDDLASVTRRTGFRTIFLNRSNITVKQLAQGIAPGANWHFEVNGHEFYAKGSNLIPPDAFWPRVTEGKMKRLFDSVIAGNQNMLRVWASGAYLPDFMYDLADERGVLLWSEFQFSDALYPTDQPFLDDVAAEVVYNVRRVNHHPSLALWAGGNEIESLQLPTAKRLDPESYPRLVGDYEHLFISLILPLVYDNSRSISYMPSSTNNGFLEVNISAPVPMAERYDNDTELKGHYYGDTDYYNYDSTVAFDFTGYPVGRFANEFGYHSMPSLQTWQQAVDNKDLHFNSSTIMLRNHHYPPGSPDTHNYTRSSIGMAEMTLAVERYYPIPDKQDPVANFSAWCHATQLFQADMYKSQIQFYRRGSGMPERQLGALYWQLEDIWQAPTWAGIEYDGRWKVLHYVARDIFQPIIVSPFWNYSTGDLSVYVTSDLWEMAWGTVKFTWMDLSGKPIPGNAGTPLMMHFSVGALNTTSIYDTNVAGLSLPNVKDAVLVIDLSAKGRLQNAGRKSLTTFTHRNQFTPAVPKDLALKNPNLKLSHDVRTGTFTVEARSAVSLYTWLDYPSGIVGYFEDNSFSLLPGEKRTLRFVVQKDETGGKWVDSVTVRSLWDQSTKS